MLKNSCIYIFLILSYIVNAQSKKEIDSINTIPLQTKTSEPVLLEKTYLKNAESAKTLNYLLGEAESYSNLSLIYYYQGKFEKDIYYSLKAISIYELLHNNEKLAIEYGELGYRMKRRSLEKAILYMQKGKNISEKNNLEKPLLSIYNNYGYLKELQKEMDSALYYYKICLKIKEKRKDSIGIPYSLNNIATIYIQQNKFKVAQILLNKSLQLRIKQKDKTGIAENYFNLGDLNFSQKKYTEAISFYNKSLNIANKSNYLYLIKNCYLELSKSYEKNTNPIQALYHYKLYSKYKDSLSNQEMNNKIAELDIKFETSKKEKQIIKQQAEVKKRNLYLTGLSGLILLLGIIAYLVNRQQKLKNQQQAKEHQLKIAITQIETQNKLQEQRLSISRDLHDNIGAQLTFIISSIDNVKYAFDITNKKLDTKLSSISKFTKETIVELRDTIWAMNSNEITFEDLEGRIHNFIEKAKEAKQEITFSFKIDENLKSKKLSSVEGMNVYRTIQEAINNSLKYANAKNIQIEAIKSNDQTKITISDNGIGFNEAEIIQGNGLNNMKKRIEEIGGKIHISSSENGTTIEVLI